MRCNPNTRSSSAKWKPKCLPACRELGIGFVPYSPLGRGLITGQVKRAEEYAVDNDNRKNMPRFQGENFDRNMERVEAMKSLAVKKGITAGPDRARLAAATRRGHRADPWHEAAEVSPRECGGGRRRADALRIVNTWRSRCRPLPATAILTRR